MTRIVFGGVEVVVNHVWVTGNGEAFAFFSVDGQPALASEAD